MPSLTKKILDSLVWVFSNMVVTNAVTFVRTIVLWHLLGASEFGLNATAWLVVHSVSFLQDMGFSQALIQRRAEVEKAASVTFFANLLIHTTLSLLFFLSAPAVASHFGEPDLLWLVRIASLSIVVRSFGSTSFALLKKDFRFKAVLFVNSSEMLISTVAQITMGVAGYGVWSLVWGHLLGVAWRTASLWVAQPLRLSRPDLRVAGEMFHFGKHVTLSALFLWLVKNLDDYLVARHLGMVALGFYTLAYRLSHMVSAKVTRLLGAVLFPAFCEIGSDYRRARAAWLKATRYVMALIVPLGLALMLFAPELLFGFYPPECQVAAVPTIILTSFAICRGVGITLGDLARGVGRPEIVTRAAMWHVLLMAPALYLAVHSTEVMTAIFEWFCEPEAVELLLVKVLLAPTRLPLTLVAVSLAVSTTAFFAIGYTFYQCARAAVLEAHDAARAIQPALVAGAAMLVSAIATKALLYEHGASWWVVIVVAGPVAAAVYLLSLWLWAPALIRDLKKIRQRSAISDQPGESDQRSAGRREGVSAGEC